MDDIKRGFSAAVQTAIHQAFVDWDNVEVHEINNLTTRIRFKQPQGGTRYFIVKLSEQM